MGPLHLLAGLSLATAAYFAFRKPKPPAWIPSDAIAIDMAIADLGGDASTEDIVQMAYSLAHPTATNPPSGVDLAVWGWITKVVQARLARGLEKVDPPKIPPKIDGSAEKVLAWIASMSGEQAFNARNLLGPPRYDPLAAGAMALNDVITRAALTTIRMFIEAKIASSKMDALALYSKAKSSVGAGNVSTLKKIMEESVGAPSY